MFLSNQWTQGPLVQLLNGSVQNKIKVTAESKYFYQKTLKTKQTEIKKDFLSLSPSKSLLKILLSLRKEKGAPTINRLTLGFITLSIMTKYSFQ